jgi:hypothetical protein
MIPPLAASARDPAVARSRCEVLPSSCSLNFARPFCSLTKVMNATESKMKEKKVHGWWPCWLDARNAATATSVMPNKLAMYLRLGEDGRHVLQKIARTSSAWLMRLSSLLNPALYATGHCVSTYCPPLTIRGIREVGTRPWAKEQNGRHRTYESAYPPFQQVSRVSTWFPQDEPTMLIAR